MSNISYQRSSRAPGGFTVAALSASVVLISAYILAAIGYEQADRAAVGQLIEEIENKQGRLPLNQSPTLSPPGFSFIQRMLGFGKLSEEYTKRLQDFMDLSIHSEDSFVLPAWEQLDGEISRASNLDSIEVFPRSKIAQIVRALDAQKSESDRVKLLVLDIKKKELLLSDRFSLAKDSLAELLGFIHLSSGDSKDTTVSFYSAGVLAELPEISGLPDEIPDLPSLRDLLLKLKATVSVRGPDAQELFVGELESLRQQSRELAVENTSIRNSLSELNSNLTTTQQKTKELRSSLLSTLRDNRSTLALIRH